MRSLFLSVIALGALGLFADHASAADGCGYDYRGRLYCAPGAQPGVPYNQRARRYQRYDRDSRDYRRDFKHRCRRGEISIGGGSARVCVRIR